MTDYHNGEEAYRLAAWLQEGAFHKMTLGDVEKAGRLLIKLQERLVELEKEYDASMVHQNNQYNRRVSERDALELRCHQLVSETNKYAAEISLGKSATIKLSMALDEAQSQSDRRAALLRQYHLGHKTPALIEAVEKELK
jgi:hypothetical protein